MAISQIEEKILGRLARDAEKESPLLAASLYQILGLSILLSQKLYRAKRLRKLDVTRDTKSLQLYHQIIWLAREGLSIAEVYILPRCQNGEQGPECRVMAAKIRASLYHIFCLFHNHPPVNGTRRWSSSSGSPPSSNRSPKQNNGQTVRPSSTSPGNAKGGNGTRRRRSSKNGLRDPIPSITSEASYITNPYSSPTSPPPAEALPPIPTEANRTPSRPPGLKPIKISSPQAAASFLLPPLNFVPMAHEHFEATQHLATTLLPPAHALRLSVTLEHAAFLWDCQKEHEQARTLAARTIKEVYTSSEGLDDEEFADAATIVQALGGIVKRGSNDSSPKLNNPNSASQLLHQQHQQQQQSKPRTLPLIDRTIALSPPSTTTTRRPSLETPAFPHNRSTPDRLSTVPEDPSQETSERENDRATTTAPTTISPPNSRLSSRTGASTKSDKAAKRRALEAAEQELYRRRSQSASASSRQNTPVEGISALTPTAAATVKATSLPSKNIPTSKPQAKSKRREKGRETEIEKSKPAQKSHRPQIPHHRNQHPHQTKTQHSPNPPPTSKPHPRIKRRPVPPAPLTIPPSSSTPTRSESESDPRREALDRRRAVLRALEVLASSSRALGASDAAAARGGATVARRVGFD
ncbi:hypothetical protein Q7P37_001061 [Cladosporium fusiforme]